MNKKLKIGLAASMGGHLNQLLKTDASWQNHNVFFVTTGNVADEQLKKYGRVYVLEHCDRRSIRSLFRVWRKCHWIIKAEKPDVVFSTGAAIGLLLMTAGKIKGAKGVWLDSITNVERLSLSGKIAHIIADVFLVQWKGLAQKYRKAEFVGEVL